VSGRVLYAHSCRKWFNVSGTWQSVQRPSSCRDMSWRYFLSLHFLSLSLVIVRSFCQFALLYLIAVVTVGCCIGRWR